ncbi:MAG: shikimate dehydrogenase, partial [Desulfobacterales bacterium]
MISTKTQLCAVIGNPVAHSLSPAIHNAAFSELNLDFVYLSFR